MAVKYRILSSIILVIVVAFLGVGYAAVTNNLSIGGTAEAEARIKAIQRSSR